MNVFAFSYIFCTGGPLQIFRKPSTAHVIGVVSQGIACGTLPSIYTRVAFYAEWIASYFSYNCMDSGNIDKYCNRSALNLNNESNNEIFQ